ncbi:DinB family protein [soil metagenome]
MTVDYKHLIIGQLEFYWDFYFFPKLDGMTDEEYLWKPVPGCWSLRPDANGLFQIEFSRPEPDPAPVTTIAWRMMHVASNIHTRASTFFGDGSVPEDASMFDPRHFPASFPGTAQAGIEFLEMNYRWWVDGLKSLDEAGFERPLGVKGSLEFADDPMAALAIHINRESMHHGGEILLLRDLYRTRGA